MLLPLSFPFTDDKTEAQINLLKAAELGSGQLQLGPCLPPRFSAFILVGG